VRETVERILTRLLIVAAVLAAASLIAQYGFYLRQRYLDYLIYVDVGIIFFFVAENFVRLGISREKLDYLKSHWMDFLFIFLFITQIVLIRFFSRTHIMETFLVKLNIVSLTKAYIVTVQVYIALALFTKTIDANRFIARLKMSAPQMVLASFAAVIAIGTVMLLLPRATTTGNSMPFVDALFTATSATCVTGLIVVDTGSYFSQFGQVIIMLLIQLGGIGIMSLVAFSAAAIGRGIGMRERAMLKDILDSNFIGEVTRLLRNIVLITVIFETAGVLVLSRIWARDFPSPMTTFYYSLFHSISAFCNAGFSLFSDSLEGFRARGDVVMTFAVLIIIGGLGFIALSNLFKYFLGWVRRAKPRPRLNLHTKIVLLTSAVLLVVGTVAFYALEVDDSMENFTGSERALSAFFSSVTARTAGFSTVRMSAIAVPTALVVIFLMFIGASSGGTGGGVKTNTFAVLIATLRSMLRARQDVEVFHRAIPSDIVTKAICVVMLSVGLVFATSLVVAAYERTGFTGILFETVSAFGTVGLSRGLTQGLTAPSKVAIIITMFLGRIGPLTLGLAISQRVHEQTYRYPKERVMIG
jgi:trk system potassium uptake protein TrkH